MIIIFLGPPGSGKGTYSKHVAHLLELTHISTGDIFRESIEQGSDLGIKVKEYLEQGSLVPDAITIEVLRARIQQSDCEKGFILDGYPRTINQALALDELVKVDIIINLVIHDEILIKKLSARRICPQCGEIYNIANIQENIDNITYDMPPMLPKKSGVCDKCGSDLIHRKDDKREIITHRLEISKGQSAPLLNFYKNKGLVEDVFVNLGLKKTIPRIMEKLKARGLV